MESQIDNEYYAKRRQQILNNIAKNNEDFYKIEEENIKFILNEEDKKEKIKKMKQDICIKLQTINEEE